MHKILRPALVLIFLSSVSFGQSYNVKLMTWNILNYPSTSNTTGDTTERNPRYRDVIEYVQPDILVTQENASNSSVPFFLNYVMNNLTNNEYSAGSFNNGPDTNNGIYFLTSEFYFVSNIPIYTALRDINEFTLVHIPTADTIRIYSCHLKAGTGSSNEAARTAEVANLRAVTNNLPAGSDFIVCGDFNVYGDYESCYINLLQDNSSDDGNFVDPLNMTGVWARSYYSNFHTQSPRTRSFGNGSTGGLDDRFDMILFSNAISQPGGITYIQGTTVPIGNDGNHYNDSINQQPNTAVPPNIADGLHYASDHLPVSAEFTFETVTGIQSNLNEPLQFNVFPNPANGSFNVNYELYENAEINISLSDITGKIVKQFLLKNENQGNHQKTFSLSHSIHPGIYLLRMEVNKIVGCKKLVVE